MTRQRVSYFYHNDVGNYQYAGKGQHPMKPHRMRMVHDLIVNYDMHRKLDMCITKPASWQDMTKFHTDEYIAFLKNITPDVQDRYPEQMDRYNCGDDCPVWPGMYEFCAISAGGSIGAAQKLNHGDSDIAINWSGGLHHAKRNAASGFCYVNDIVLSILELLKYHARVLYIDIDIHHGDGVEEAFYTTDRVMTVSFHKFGEGFFPGTGDVNDTGIGRGKDYSANIPLKDGIDDDSYASVFRPVISSIMQFYNPSAIVLQCGADSLAGDRLGVFNLSSKGHASCIEFVKSFNRPLVVLGGGGYSIRNVPRAWCYETSLLINHDLSEDIPYNEYFEYYGPTYKILVEPSNMENQNTRKDLDKLVEKCTERIRGLNHAPSVPIQSVPGDWEFDESDSGEDEEKSDQSGQ